MSNNNTVTCNVTTSKAAVMKELEASWRDITQDFESACSDLSRGELVHDEMFGLFEAMSAIEMMDPKMDAGMMCNRINRKVLGLKDSIAAGLVKVKDIRNDEMIGIMDDTMCCLMSWLDGHTLAQTLFTNLYLHDPQVIEDKCLKSFSLLILSLTDIMRIFVMKAEVMEEEDFQYSLYNYKLHFNNFNESKICTMIKEVEDEIAKRMKSLIKSSSSSSTAKTIAASSVLPASCLFPDPVSEKEWNQLHGILSRIRLLRSLLMSLLIILRETNVPPAKDTAGQNRGSSTSTSTSSSSVLQSNPNLVSDVSKHLSLCCDCIRGWRESIAFGIAPVSVNSSSSSSSSNPNSASSNGTTTTTTTTTKTTSQSSSTCDQARADYPVIMGFEPLINQRLLPATFPRYTRLRNRSDSLNELEILIHRLQHVVKVKEVSDFHAALEFFCDFSSRFYAGTCVLSRSVLQLTYVPQAVTPSSRDMFVDLMRDACNAFIRPPSLQAKLFTTTNGCKVAIESFFVNSLRPMLSLIQIQGHNRARQREKLSQILDEMTAFHTEAERVDLLLNEITSKMDPKICHLGFFSTWTLYHVIKVMIMFVNSGFDLDLYSDHEFPYIYWYLYEFLYAWLISTLTRASNLLIEQQNFADFMKSRQNNKKSSKSKNKKLQQQQHKDRPHARSLMQCQAMQQLSGGIFKTVLAFRLQGRLRQPETLVMDTLSEKTGDTTTTTCCASSHHHSCNNNHQHDLMNRAEKLRFEHRFMPFFSVITPPAISYQQFRDMCDQVNRTGPTAPQDLLSGAYQCFDDAKKILSAIPDPSEEITSCLKVAKTNQVVTKLLASGIQTSKSYPEFDFSVSSLFPIIRAL